MDDFSRKVCTFILKRKHETFEIFKACKFLVENQTVGRLEFLEQTMDYIFAILSLINCVRTMEFRDTN